MRCFALLAVGGCGLSTLDLHETCDLEVELSVAEAVPGEEVVISGGPQTATYDSHVEVGGLPAVVVDVDRNGACGACETCRVDAGCLVCGTCLGTDLEEADRIACFGDPFEGTEGVCGECEESLVFVVPDLPAGPTTLVVVNATGISDPIPFTIAASATPTADTFETGSTTDTVDTGSTMLPTADTADTADTSGTADTFDTADTIDTVDTTDTIDTTDTAATAWTADTVDTTDTADTVDTVDTVDTADTVDTGPTGSTADTGA